MEESSQERVVYSLHSVMCLVTRRSAAIVSNDCFTDNRQIKTSRRLDEAPQGLVLRHPPRTVGLKGGGGEICQALGVRAGTRLRRYTQRNWVC